MKKPFLFILSFFLLASLASCNKDKKDNTDLLALLGLGGSTSGTHTLTFVNNTGEDLWVGVWGSVRGFASKGYDPPAGWSEWKLSNGETKTWSAPAKFNGRVFPRTGCVSGTCTGGNCGGTKCTVSAEPVSLVEFNMDDGDINWYDVSYVDGYNFPITVVPSRTACSDAGCDTLPTCPWSYRSGVCFGSCKEFTQRYLSDYTSRDEFYKVCCKCQVPQDQCDCGDTCSGKSACTSGYGCSIYAAYSDPLAEGQCCCSPLRPDQEVTPLRPCRTGGDWPTSYEGLNYQSYPRGIKDVCTNAYTWQYHDTEGLFTCNNDSGTPVNFTITFHPRP